MQTRWSASAVRRCLERHRQPLQRALIFKIQEIELITLNRTDLRDMVSNNRVIGFGAGEIGELTLRLLNCKLQYFVDNDSVRHSTDWHEEISVHPPERLRAEPAGTIVLVCSDGYEKIGQQVHQINPALRCYLTPLLKNTHYFERLLNCSRNILVSSYHVSGGLYLVDGRAKTFRRLVRGAFRGLTVASGRLFVLEDSGNVLELLSLDPFSAELRITSQEYSNAHGLASCPELDFLFLAETKIDRISMYALSSFDKVGEIALDELTRGADRFHVNDLCIVDNTLFYSLFSQRGSNRSQSSDGAVVARQLPAANKPQVIVSDLNHLHSVRYIDDQLMVIESTTGTVRSVEGATVFAFPGYLRGLNGTKNTLYISQSRHRGHDVLSEAKGASIDTGIHVVDSEHRLSSFVRLPDSCEIYDLLNLEEAEIAMDLPSIM